MIVWKHRRKEITSIDCMPKDAIGFVYELEYEDGTKYIGKKFIITYKTLPALQSGKQRPNSDRIQKRKNGKLKKFDVVYTESDWLNYEGSHKNKISNLKAKRILEYAVSDRHLTYLEAKHLFEKNVLETKEYLNDNILGKFYRKTLFGD